jgi:hypothetical protein
MEYRTLIQSSLVKPDWYGNPNTWRGHVPFAIWLVQTYKPQVIVDFGTYRCASYFNFCRAVRMANLSTKCYSVDRWESDEQVGFSEDHALTDAHRYNECVYPDISRLLRVRSGVAADHFSDASIDLLHINGFYTYASVKKAFETWLPKLMPSAVVLFHHTNVKAGEFGVWRLWEDLTRRYPSNLEFVHSQGLGVLQLAQGEGRFFLDWLLPDAVDKQVIREYFGNRGVELEQQFDGRCVPDPEPHPVSAERDKAAAEVRTLRHALAKRDRAIAEIATLHRQLAERERIITELGVVSDERDAMANSLSWRITKPFRLAVGVLRGEPAYLARLRALVGRGDAETKESPTTPRSSPDSGSETVPDTSVRGLVAAALPELIPLATYPDPSPGRARRLTVVTDALGAETAFGGMDIPILLAAALARHRGLRLRFVTRDSPPEPAYVGAVLAAHDVSYADNMEFEYAPARTDARALADASNEVILTTSWSTTWAARKSFDPTRIIYLVQHDERMFYPAGDQQLRCREILCDSRLRFVVASPVLLNYLIAQGMTGVSSSGIVLEAAFPSIFYYRAPRSLTSKRRFFFDARPNSPRNLFLRGLESVAGAIESDSLPAADWEFFFVGKNIPIVKLPRGVRPRIVENPSTNDLGELIRQVDVGLSLTYAPQLGYSALTLAASGAVVVTSRFGSSLSPETYCSNILCVEPSLDELGAALAKAGELAANEPLRQANYESARIARDWDAVFAPVVEALLS